MSKFKKYSDKTEAEIRSHEDEKVENFMGGISYTMTPLTNLEIIAASSIFGEPSHYRSGLNSKSSLAKKNSFYDDTKIDSTVKKFML